MADKPKSFSSHAGQKFLGRPGQVKGGPISQDAMNISVWNKAQKKAVGGAAFDNPNLVAQGAKARERMTPPESVMDPRYAEWKKQQEDAEALDVVSDLILSALPVVGPAVKGVTAAGKALSPAVKSLGPTLDSMIIELMQKQGLAPGIVPKESLLNGAKVIAAAGKTADELAAVKKVSEPVGLAGKLSEALAAKEPPMTTPQVTALKTKPELYVDNLERLINRTAEQTGKNRTEVLNDMLTGKGFLYKKGGKVQKKADGGLTSDDLIVEERKL